MNGHERTEVAVEGARVRLDENGASGDHASAAAPVVCRGLGHDARPDLVVSIAGAGDLVQWRPQLHLLTTSIDDAKRVPFRYGPKVRPWPRAGCWSHVSGPLRRERLSSHA